MKFLCWLGLHSWGFWSDPIQVNYSELLHQECRCIHCGKIIHRVI